MGDLFRRTSSCGWLNLPSHLKRPITVWSPTAKPVIACIAEPNAITELRFTNSNESPAPIESPDPLPADDGELAQSFGKTAITHRAPRRNDLRWPGLAHTVTESRGYGMSSGPRQRYWLPRSDLPDTIGLPWLDYSMPSIPARTFLNVKITGSHLSAQPPRERKEIC
jgi:hypothetical protein